MAAEKCPFTGLIDSEAALWGISLCLSRSPYYGGPQRQYTNIYFITAIYIVMLRDRRFCNQHSSAGTVQRAGQALFK